MDIEKSKYSGFVYNFECDTHTYMCHHITTHNCDPISQDATQIGDSLASMYIMRRNHTDISDPYREVMVASYTARPKSFIKDYLKNVELLQEFYNCQILHEATNNPVFAYFDMKRKSHILMDSFSLQKSINPNTKASSPKGMPATPPNNKARLEVLLTYLEEDLPDGQLGYTRILDPLLIDELIAYDGMGQDSRNTDRIDAFTLALIQITSLEKFNKTRPFVTHTPKEKKPNRQLKRDALGRYYYNEI